MNTDKVKWLINRLENEVDDKHFFMAAWLSAANEDHRETIVYLSEKSIPHCQTAGCIAGAVFLGLTPEERREYHNRSRFGFGTPAEIAGRAELDLTMDQAHALFQPAIDKPLKRITRQDAIDCLNVMLTYNVIDWGYVLHGKARCLQPATPV